MSYTVPPGGLAPVHRLDDYRNGLAPQAPVDEAEIWGEVLAAAQLFGTLRAAGMSVRFDSDGDGSPPRVRVTDLGGRTLRVIPSSIACDPQALEAALLSA